MRKHKKHVLFKDLAIGQSFSFSGLEFCIKKSSRTAYIDSEKTLWFYFGQKDNCYVETE